MMTNSLNWISKNVMTYKTIIVISLILLVLLGIQKGIAVVVRGSVTTWEGTCSFGGWDDNKEHLGFVVNCGEKGTDTILRTSFIRSYLVNPGPLNCRLDLDNDIECDARPEKLKEQ